MKIKEIKRIVKDNKKEILIFTGSAAMLGLGVYLTVKDAKYKIEFDKLNRLKNKEIVDAFATIEYTDGEVGIVKLAKAENWAQLFEVLFPGE